MERLSQRLTLATSSIACLFFVIRLVGEGATLLPLVGFFCGAVALGATLCLWQVRRTRGAAA